MCPGLEVPKHSTVLCNNPSLNMLYNYTTDNTHFKTIRMPIDTECSIKCAEGLTIGGSSVRNCLLTATWSGRQTVCRSKFILCNSILYIIVYIFFV